MSRPLSALPGPAPLPLIGNLAALGGDPLGFMAGLAAEYGGLVRFRIGSQDTLLVSDPALVEQVLVKLREATVKDPVTAGLSDVLGQGLLTAEGELWRRNRRTIAPSFQPGQLAALGEVMVASTARSLDGLVEGPVDVHEHMMGLTLDIAVRTLFGAELHDAARVGPLVEELMVGFDRQMHTWRRLLPAWVPTAARREAAHHKAELHSILQVIVDQKRQAQAAGEEGADLLSRLLAARDEEGQPMGDDQLRDELLTLFLAGHETTALTLGYALWLLANHPDVQQRLHEELTQVLEGRDPTSADCRRLPYVDAVVQESMRLYPPAWVVGRQAAEDLVLDDVAVPKGTVLLMPQWVVHRDSRWFPEPLQFRPERWLAGEERPKFSFFPFGGGQRVCVGNHFARMEAVLVLAMMLTRLELRPQPGFELQVLPSVTLRPRGGIVVRQATRPGAPGAPGVRTLQ